jgi:hypothetical protein
MDHPLVALHILQEAEPHQIFPAAAHLDTDLPLQVLHITQAEVQAMSLLIHLHRQTHPTVELEMEV